ncbi:hypothetical protein LRAMOSA00904 [Lichtheimia ramosa]|uniref:Transcription factor Aft1 HRA domain-containing protein n=1 Tax=Lichtheimia ramosa TaxID=688394 RepID=A0A077W7X6_9FUNG|nr:hypothetical protein LRAMOSA00904 [Lichtheimia ramosa]
MVNEPSEVTVTTGQPQDRPEPSPPMAVLPLNPSAKLDQEPNPFEESFSTAANNNPSSSNNGTKKPVLPPVAAITSPVPPLLRSGVLPKDVANQFAWDSLRAGPLSPSMLQGPSQPSTSQQGQEHMSSTRDNLNNNTTTGVIINNGAKRSGSLCSGSSSSSSTTITGENHHASKKRSRSNSKDEDDEKRRNFLERNRIGK